MVLTGFNAINHDHSLHSLTAGPDGKFYFNNGNRGLHSLISLARRLIWAELMEVDQIGLQTIYNSGRESGTVMCGPQALVVRMDQDGSNVEIVSHGLRNL